MKPAEPIIVGVDPGSTSAYAALDLDGETIRRDSGKNFPPREIIREIIEIGKPVLVASDKEKTPSKVEKIGKSLGAEIFSPEEDLAADKKRKLGGGDNSHEKDAEASARHAYRNMKDSIKKIKDTAEQKEVSTAEAAESMFKGEKLVDRNSKEPEEDVKTPETDEERFEDSPGAESYRRENDRLKARVENLKERVKELEEELGEKEQALERAERRCEDLKTEKREELMKDREVKKREKVISEKQERIEELEDKLERSRVRERQYENALEVLEQGGEILPVVEERDEVPQEACVTRSREIREELNSRGKKVFHVDEVEGVELLERMAVKEIPERKFDDVIREYRENR